MVLPHVISQREDSAPWTTTICQTMHRVAIAPITDRMPTKNARNVRCDITGRPARCWMWCAGSHDLTSPLRTRASHRFHHNLNLSPQRTSPPGCAGFQPACRVRRRRARMPGAQASRLHTAVQPIRGRDALIPKRVCSPRCEQLHNLSYCFTAGIVLYCDPILG